MAGTTALNRAKDGREVNRAVSTSPWKTRLLTSKAVSPATAGMANEIFCPPPGMRS